MSERSAILFVLGPSGTGKTRFSQFLASKHDWLHLEIDQYPNGDGTDIKNLRKEWDLFFNSRDPKPLARELRSRTVQAKKRACVLSFPSGVVLFPDHLDAGRKGPIDAVYLYGSAAHCINAFLQRESRTGRNLDLNHWLRNNSTSYVCMSRPEFEPYRIHVFTHRGQRRSCVNVFRAVQRLTNRARGRRRTRRALATLAIRSEPICR